MPDLDYISAYVERLIGRPYDIERFRCWDLVELVERDLFGRAMLPVPSGELSQKAAGVLISVHPERERWQAVPAPRPGSIALMAKVRFELHAGVWLPLNRVGGILHVDRPHGVAFEPVADLICRGFPKITFYEPKPV